MMKKRYCYCILVLLLFVFLCHPAFAAKCVRPNGAGGCFDSIQDAIGAVAEGGTVKVYPGIYYGYFDADKTGITIMGMGNKRTDVRIDTGGDPFSNHITAASVTVRNLTIQNSSNGIQCTTLAPDNAKVVNVNIFNSTNNGINIISGDDILIKNCKILNSGGHGIDTDGARLTVQNTIIYDCQASGIHCIGEQLTVEGCTINDAEQDLIHVEASYPTIQNNKFFLSGRYGLRADSDFIKVTENIVRGTTESGICIIGEAPIVKKNTVMHSMSRGFDIIVTSGDSKVVNNLSSHNGGIGFLINSPSSLLFKKNKAYYNDGSGIYLEGSGEKTITENQSKNNGRIGFYVEHGYLEGNTASENGTQGYYLGFTNHTAIRNKALNNMEQGFWLSGNDSLVRNNRAIGNISHGIYITGDNNEIINNTMLDSRYDKCDEGTNNTWTDNTHDTECP